MYHHKLRYRIISVLPTDANNVRETHRWCIGIYYFSSSRISVIKLLRRFRDSRYPLESRRRGSLLDGGGKGGKTIYKLFMSSLRICFKQNINHVSVRQFQNGFLLKMFLQTKHATVTHRDRASCKRQSIENIL